MSDIALFIILVLIAVSMLVVLVILFCSFMVSGECSRKEEQEEIIRKLEGQEQKLDDYNLEEDLVYDDDFVKKEDK